MTRDGAVLYRALAARDARFDGVFFVGVTSTGIYCRPVCTARTPRRENCTFFTSAAAAERASFRPCLRCRPELAPGHAPVDGGRRVAAQIAHRIASGVDAEDGGLERIASEMCMSSRQMRRIVQRELGVTPIELVQTHRLLLAKQLLTETSLSVTQVAYASGFGSLRRFNDAFRRRYGMAPTRLRKEASNGNGAVGETLTLRVAYRPAFDWDGLLGFLALRALRGVEVVRDGAYLRTVRIGDRTGWIRVTHAPTERGLRVELTHSLVPCVPRLLARVRNLFDLDARPDLIARDLGRDPRLASSLSEYPGLRVPGAFDGFELAARAILGQQVTVRAAATLAGRFSEAFGERFETPHEGLTRLAPTAEVVAGADVDAIASLGIVGARARSLIALARAVADGVVNLESGADHEETRARLVELPGIGPWTAEYIGMRALRWPDAFPREDIAVRKALGGATAAEAERLSEAWRPWRSYAVLHLWRAA